LSREGVSVCGLFFFLREQTENLHNYWFIHSAILSKQTSIYKKAEVTSSCWKSKPTASYTQLIKSWTQILSIFQNKCCLTLSQLSLSARESNRRLSFWGISFSIRFMSSIKSASGQSGISATNMIFHYSGVKRCRSWFHLLVAHSSNTAWL
jgi:hypothetical protein